MVAAAGLQGQVWFWAAWQVGAPSGIPSGVGLMRLQPTRLMLLMCRPSPLDQHDRRACHGSEMLFVIDNPPNPSAGGFVITCSLRDQMPARMQHRLPRRLA